MEMQIVAWVASFFVFLAFFMKTIIPLRIMAIMSNVTFIAYTLMGINYGIFEKLFAIFILHVLLLPLNIVRLYQMLTLIQRVKEASTRQSSPVEFLIPYMNKKRFSAGQELFRKDDVADKIFYIQEGSVYLTELEKQIPRGTVLGEVGIFAPENRRVSGARCAEESVIYEIHKDKVLELFYQNPKFGFYLVRSISQLVKEHTDRELMHRTIQPAL